MICIKEIPLSPQLRRAPVGSVRVPENHLDQLTASSSSSGRSAHDFLPLAPPR